jgi:hypothetical protein
MIRSHSSYDVRFEVSVKYKRGPTNGHYVMRKINAVKDPCCSLFIDKAIAM